MAPSPLDYDSLVHAYFTTENTLFHNRTHLLCFRVFYVFALCISICLSCATTPPVGFYRLRMAFCLNIYVLIWCIILELLKYIPWILIWFAWIRLNKLLGKATVKSIRICVIDHRGAHAVYLFIRFIHLFVTIQFISIPFEAHSLTNGNNFISANSK